MRINKFYVVYENGSVGYIALNKSQIYVRDEPVKYLELTPKEHDFKTITFKEKSILMKLKSISKLERDINSLKKELKELENLK